MKNGFWMDAQAPTKPCRHHKMAIPPCTGVSPFYGHQPVPEYRRDAKIAKNWRFSVKIGYFLKGLEETIVKTLLLS